MRGVPGDIAEMAYARAHRIEASVRTWNTLPTTIQELVLNLVDGREHLESLGSATVAELAELGLVERDGDHGVQWTPLGYDIAGWLGDRGGSDAG